MNATLTRPAAQPKQRTCRIDNWSGGTGTLTIHDPAAKRADRDAVYDVEEFPIETDGRAFRLVKHGAEESTYDVLITPDPTGCMCFCMAGSRWGTCRHTASLASLIRRGLLPEGGAS